MKNKRNLTKAWTSALFVMMAALAGCDRGPLPADAGAQSGVSAHSYAYSGAGVTASSRVERQTSDDGAETLRGTTEVALSGAARPVIVAEEAHLDATGRLVSATTELRSGGTTLRSVKLDSENGLVTVRDEHGETSWRVANDHPWAYAGLFDDIAPQAAGVSAVQAWIARRASAAGPRVRMVEVLSQRSSVTLSDQIVFNDGDRDLVVVGDEVAEAGPDFVRALPWKALESVSNELRAAEAACERHPGT